MDPVLSVVLPTYNEAGNLPEVVARIARALSAIPHEIVVADDDSPDRTWEVAEELRKKFPQLRCLRRTGPRGLYPAVLDAFRLCSGAYLAVMDADLQHDEGALPGMLAKAREGPNALVVATRYGAGGGIEDWGRLRRVFSSAATGLVGALLRLKVTDPLSGFFLIDRSAYLELAPRLRPKGFKILMDILANLPAGASVGEVGYVFRPRKRGESKLGLAVTANSLWSLFQLAVRRCRRTPR